MALDGASGQSDYIYTTAFRQYIHRSARATLDSLRNIKSALSVEHREHALHTLHFALGLPEAWSEARELLILLAPKVEQAGFRLNYVPFLQRGIELCQATRDETSQAEMEFHLGVLLIAIGRMEEARSYFKASTLRFQTAGDPRGQARSLNRWAYLDRLQQRSDSAFDLTERAMSLVTTEDPEAFYGQFVLGCLAVDRHDWSQALDCLSHALVGWQSLGDQVMIARGLTNLGTALRGAGQSDQAIDHYLQAIDMMVKLDDVANEAVTRMNLGNVYREQGQLVLAMAQYHQAEQVFRQTEDYLRLSRVNLNMGLVYMRTGQWPLAHSTLNTAIDFFRLLGDHRATANAMDALAEVYLLQGQYSVALTVLEQALTELNGLEDHPGHAPLLKDIDQHLVEARRGIELQESGVAPVFP